jgi:hypothetical protein
MKVSKSMNALRKAASKAVKENTTEITQSLLTGAVAGKTASAKLLIELAESQPEDGEKNQPLGSVAEKLEKEPQWQGDALEMDLESGEP